MTSVDNQLTPLDQLNLLLSLAWYPVALYENTGIYPVFSVDGFELQAIGPNIATPMDIFARANASGISINQSASPELVLKNKSSNLLAIVECKQSSFGVDSSTARQAAVLLTSSGNQLARILGIPEPMAWASATCYAVNNDEHEVMYRTLGNLTNSLNSAQIATNSTSTIGIKTDNDGIYVHGVFSEPTFPTIHTKSIDGQWLKVVDNEKVGGSPRLLQLIPVDPSIGVGDREQWEIMERKLRSAIVSEIGSKLDEEEFSISQENIMQNSIAVWDYWEDANAKRGLMKHVRTYIRNIKKEIIKIGASVEESQGTYFFSNVTFEISEKVRKYLLSKDFRNGRIEWIGDQRQLGFDTLDQEWE